MPYESSFVLHTHHVPQIDLVINRAGERFPIGAKRERENFIRPGKSGFVSSIARVPQANLVGTRACKYLHIHRTKTYSKDTSLMSNEGCFVLDIHRIP